MLYAQITPPPNSVMTIIDISEGDTIGVQAGSQIVSEKIGCEIFKVSSQLILGAIANGETVEDIAANLIERFNFRGGIEVIAASQNISINDTTIL